MSKYKNLKRINELYNQILEKQKEYNLLNSKLIKDISDKIELNSLSESIKEMKKELKLLMK